MVFHVSKKRCQIDLSLLELFGSAGLVGLSEQLRGQVLLLELPGDLPNLGELLVVLVENPGDSQAEEGHNAEGR